MMKKSGVLLLLLALLAACAQHEEEKPKARDAALVTVATAQTVDLEIHERTIGTLEGLIDPTVGAEVAGRVVQVHAYAGQTVTKGQLLAVLDAQDYDLLRREARAEIKRIEALLENQSKVLARNRQLVEKNFISQNALDEIESQRTAIAQQLEVARARLASVEHDGSKARIYSPLTGRVETQIVSVGDYAKEGDPLFRIISTQRLRAHLPFPETVAASLKPGQTVRLSTPTAPEEVITTTIKEIKPLIASTNRAVDVIADVVDQAGWHPGASVNATVVLGVRRNSVVVPEQSVVLRPAGDVVYVVKDNTAYQRVVRVGLREAGQVEILEGLAQGEVVALDGAAYLTDQAALNIQAERS